MPWDIINMKRIIKPIGSGKTYDLIKLCSTAEGVMVAYNQEQCDAIKLAARNMGFPIDRTVTFAEFANRDSRPRGRVPRFAKYYIDNLDLFLGQFGVVEGITMDSDSNDPVTYILDALSGIQIVCREDIPAKPGQIQDKCGDEVSLGNIALCDKCKGRKEVLDTIKKSIGDYYGKHNINDH